MKVVWWALCALHLLPGAVAHAGSHVVDGVGGAVVLSLLLQAALLSAAARSAAPRRARGASVPARP